MPDPLHPWDEIRTPTSDYNVRLVVEHGAVPVYWGKDREGHCLLIVELSGDHTEQFRMDVLSVHGIRIDLRDGETAGQQRLVLTLEKHIDRDLFDSFCRSLIAKLQPVGDPAEALAVALAHIRRWKAFLAGRKTGILSPDQVRGLFAELLFLQTVLRGPMDEVSAIHSWSGADRIHQDFMFGNTAVEIKSVSGRDRSTVRISSEDQLETTLDRLFMLTYRLSELPEAAGSQSLNDLVVAIEAGLTDADGIEEFARKLAAYGYAPLQEYDNPLLVTSGIQAYRVKKDFPRLIRSRLPDGIVRVGYEIELEKMDSYKCGITEIFEGE